MATRTIARLFDSYNDASAAVADLEAAGFLRDDISLIANRGTTTTTAAPDDTSGHSGTGAGTGATLGAVVGGGAGLLAGLGALAIPGVGPVVAAGWLVATLAGAGVGAAGGGLLGGLVGSGVSEEHAHVYAEGIRRGGNLVTVRTDETRVAQAESILARHNPADASRRASEYRATGWKGYDENAGPWTGPSTTESSATGSSAPDGTPGNPPGTAASRAFDRTAGTNVSGAYPEQSDGTPRNPPGTAAGRAVGTTRSDRDPV
jgi:hypothetical protein